MSMDWIKVFTRKWIWGSGRMMTPEKRGVWIDLLALAAETKFRDGTLRFEVGSPMPRDYIAGVLNMSRDILDASLSAFQADINTDDGTPRIVVWEDGTIQLTNWFKYQSSEKDEMKQAAIDKAKETRRRQKLATDRLVTAVGDLNTNIHGITSGKDMFNGVCAYCGHNGMHDYTDYARHIRTAKDSKHVPGLAWANEYLDVED